MATERIPHCCGQVRKCIQIASEGWETTDRLGITISADCDKQLARTYIDAGCMRVQDGQFLAPFLGSLRHWFLRWTGWMPKARIKANSQSRSSSKLTSVITRLYAKLGPTLMVGLLKRRCRRGL